MATDPLEPAADDRGIFSNPWPAMWAGLIATALALAASLVLSHALVAVWLVLLLLGLAAAGAAVTIRPGSWQILLCAAGVTLMATMIAEHSGWDSSAASLFWIATAVTAVAAVLLLLPRTARRLVISLLILFHFGGIFTAITAAPPQSWLSGQLWVYVYRPYLQFMYLNNAYHFYSPEPGPANLLWMRIEYEKDPDNPNKSYSRWVKIPDLDENGKAIDDLPEGGTARILKLEFTRRLSLVEMASQPGLIPANFQTEYAWKRDVAGTTQGIPRHPAMPVEAQYREPSMVSKIWLSSYAKYVCATYKHETRPEKKAVKVKIYRVVHQIMAAWEYAAGRRMDDPSLYLPFYQGEYDADGNLLSRTYRFTEQGGIEEVYRDPLLYWLIPIVPEFPENRDPRNFAANFRHEKVINYLKKHAGDTEEDSKP